MNISVGRKTSPDLFDAIHWATGATSKPSSSTPTNYLFRTSIFFHESDYENHIDIVATDGARLHRQTIRRHIFDKYWTPDFVNKIITPSDTEVDDWRAYKVTRRTKTKVDIDFSDDCRMPNYLRVIPDTSSWFKANSVNWPVLHDATYPNEILIAKTFPTMIGIFLAANNIKIPVLNPDYIDTEMPNFDYFAVHPTESPTKPFVLGKYFPGKYGPVERLALIMPVRQSFTLLELNSLLCDKQGEKSL